MLSMEVSQGHGSKGEVMWCSFGSAAEITECVVKLRSWFDIANGLLGLVSAGAVTSLLFVIRQWRNDKRMSSDMITGLKQVVEDQSARLKDSLARDVVDRFRLAIRKTIAGWYHSDLHRAPTIPDKKAQTARGLANIPIDEEMLALFDLTFVGNAKYFLAITYTGLYWRGPSSIEWRDFANADITEKDGNIVIADRQPCRVSSGSPPGEFVAMLHALRTDARQRYERPGT
jgi:hypothetical protein